MHGFSAVLDHGGARCMLKRHRDAPVDEATMRDLIDAHPQVLPINDIDEAWSGAVSLGTEIASGSGPMDVLLVNEAGRLVIVETKLFRNPEGRREALAQIIDYASHLKGLQYDELARRVAAKKPGLNIAEGSDGLIAAAAAGGHFEVEDVQSFRASVQARLDVGEFLLLIVGEGIKPALQVMAEYLEYGASMPFTLALVELQHFTSADGTSTLWVPQVLQRMLPDLTRVWVPEEPADPAVQRLAKAAKTASKQGVGSRITLGKADAVAKFEEDFRASSGKGLLDRLDGLLEAMSSEGFVVDYKSSGNSVIIRYEDAESGWAFNLLGIDRQGNLNSTGFLGHDLDKYGLPMEWANGHYDTIAAMVPGAAFVHSPSTTGPNRWLLKSAADTLVGMADLLPEGDDERVAALVDCCQTTSARIQAAIGFLRELGPHDDLPF